MFETCSNWDFAVSGDFAVSRFEQENLFFSLSKEAQIGCPDPQRLPFKGRLLLWSLVGPGYLELPFWGRLHLIIPGNQKIEFRNPRFNSRPLFPWKPSPCVGFPQCPILISGNIHWKRPDEKIPIPGIINRKLSNLNPHSQGSDSLGFAATQLALSLLSTQHSNYIRNGYRWCAVLGKPGSAWPNRTALPQWTLDTWMLFWSDVFVCWYSPFPKRWDSKWWKKCKSKSWMVGRF